MAVRRFYVYRRILKFLAPHRRQFGAALLCMTLFGASSSGIPFILKYILDHVFQEGQTGLLYLVPMFLVGFAIFRGAVDFGQSFLMSRVGHMVVRDVRSALNEKLLGFSPGYFVRNPSGDLLSRITSDVVLVRILLTETSGGLLRDSIAVLALVGTAIYLDPFLALIAFVGFPLAVFPVIRFGRKMRRLSKRGQDDIGVLSSRFQETLLGNRVVKLFGREQFERERFEQLNGSVTRTFISSERVKALTGPVNEVLGAAAISGVVLYGGYTVLGGVRTQGDFVSFLAAVFLLYDPFKKLSRVNNAVQQGLAGAERIFEVLDTPLDIEDPRHPVELPDSNAISFDAVTFSYPSTSAAALHEVSLSIPEGKTYALVGFSGSGKSTLIDLLPRFIDPQEGVVRFGGVDLRTLRLADLRSRVAMVGQHTFLFNETIRFNIAYGRLDATREEIEEAARAAYAFDFIAQLPRGFDTVVGEGGFSLSGGERQRIAIARAVLKNAPVLVLDEATAALDNRSEREVQAALERLMQGRTSIVIAHRLSTVQSADQIVVLRDGRIVEQGTHQELLGRGGEYMRLYQLQFREGNGSAAREGATRLLEENGSGVVCGETLNS